jgi:putative FmdB family regulatory protein
VPTYSYRCTECDNAFDIQQSFSDDSLTVCPVCGGKLRKVFSPIGVTFNGSGFYRTDSRATPKEGSSSSSESKSSESKPSESKPAAKESKPSSSSSGSSGSSGSSSGSSSSSSSGSKTPSAS